MTIDEIKQALREVREICRGTEFCKNCPLADDAHCPMRDKFDSVMEYPADWPLEWKEQSGR